MAQASVLSQSQFRGKRQKRVDPHTTDMGNTRFSGDPGASKTMTVSGGSGLPKPQDKHIHHRKAGRRSKRVA
jgi:hypothetical protein